MDPLTLLQEYASRDGLDKVRLTEARVEFEDSYTFPRDTLTAYRGRQGKGDFYSLVTLLVFLRNVKVKLAEYIATAKSLNVSTVHFIDRKELVDYLTQLGAGSTHVQPAALELHFAGQPQDGVAPEAKRARLSAGVVGEAAEVEGGEGAAALLADIVKHERDLRDRNSGMSVPSKRFTRGLELGARTLRQLDPSRQQQHQRPHAPPSQQARQAAVLPVRPSGRYERGVGENTAVMEVGGAMQINTYGPASQARAAAATGVPPPPLRRPSSQAAGMPVEQRHSGSHPSHSQAKSLNARSPAKVERRPIVLVPKGYETKLNMFNAKLFLEEGRFCGAEEAKRGGATKPAEAPFHRTFGVSRPVSFLVSEKAPDVADKAAWSRVLAVFVQGKEWQFREWPFQGVAKGDMVDTFNRVLGVYLAFQKEEVPPLVKSWNVRVLRLHPNDRHGDMEVLRQFYSHLDALVETRSKRS